MDVLNNQGRPVDLDFYKAVIFTTTLNACCPLLEIHPKESGVLGFGKSKLLIHPIK
jgi:hypothetical protein